MVGHGIRGLVAAVALTLSAGADVGKYVEQLNATEREARREAAYQLTQMGAAARPALPSLLKALDDPDRQVWAYAVTAIANIGPAASEAIPKLMEAMDSRKSRGFRPRDKAQIMFRSAYALTQIGAAAKPDLLAALKGDDTGLRIGAAKALGGMGDKAPEAVPGLIENLGHADPEVQVEAVDALVAIGKASVEPLTSSLGWPDARVRIGSARALGGLGALAASAGAAILQRAKDDSDMPVRAAALVAAPKVGVAAGDVTPVLIAALKHPDAEMQRAAMDALLLVRPAGATVVPALRELLKDPAFAERAATFLGRLGREARAAVPALLPMAAKAESPDSPYIQAVVAIGGASVPGVIAEISKLPVASLTDEHWTVRILGTIGAAGLPELQKALGDSSPSVRVAALKTIGRLGLDGREVRDAVAALVRDREPTVRAAALPAMVAIGTKPPAVIEAVENGLADREAVVRVAAANAAGMLAGTARPLTGKVATLINDADGAVQIASVQALGRIGGSGEWTGQLVARLSDPKLQLVVVQTLGKLKVDGVAEKMVDLYPKAPREVRVAILDALGNMGGAGVPVLEAATKDEDPGLRATALRSLAETHPPLDGFIPTLVAGVEDGNLEVRQAAAEVATDMARAQPEKMDALIAPLMKLAEQESERTMALTALRAFRVRNIEIVLAALDHPTVEVRIWAIERMGRMGSQARAHRDKLERLRGDPNEYLRRAARRALDQMGR